MGTRGFGEYAVRVFLLAFALMLMAFGVAFAILADLGISPISCPPYVLSLALPLTVGELTIIMHVGMILLQPLLIGRAFKPVQLLQLPVGIFFGLMIDFAVWLTAGFPVPNYAASLAYCFFSCALVGFGVFSQVKADLIPLAGEGLNLALCKRFGWLFGNVKIGMDCSLVAVGLICSLLFVGGIQGIREGTLIAAVLVGVLVRFIARRFTLWDSLLARFAPAVQPTPSAVADLPYAADAPPVLALSREHGSGGHELGQALAKRLGYAFYDAELLELTAQKLGLSRQEVEKEDQKLSAALLYDLYAQYYAYAPDELPPADAVFLAQTRIIRELAAQGPCVIVGRCANFILKGRPQLFSVFLHADEEERAARIIRRDGVKPDEAAALLQRTDNERRRHCRYYTGMDWGRADLYDLCLDVSRVGMAGAEELMLRAMVLQRKAAEVAA